MIYLCSECGVLSKKELEVMSVDCSICNCPAYPINKEDITIGDIYNTRKHKFTSYQGWSWVIYYSDKKDLRVIETLTTIGIKKIDDDLGNIYHMLLEVARDMGLVE